MADEPRKLERDPDNKMIAGVASGVAEYLGVDPTIVRVIWAITFFLGLFGAVVYVIMWIVVPEAAPGGPASADGPPSAANSDTSDEDPDERDAKPAPTSEADDQSDRPAGTEPTDTSAPDAPADDPLDA